MKIGCVYTHRESWPKWKWVCSAISRLGHTVVKVNRADHLKPADEYCDLLLFEQRDCGVGWRHIRDLAPKRKSKWAQWWWDLHAWDRASLEAMLERNGGTVRMFDRVYFKERSLIPLYRQNGVNAAYLDQGIPSDWLPTVHQDEPQWDVLVFGRSAPIYKARVRAVKAMVAAGLKVAWATTDGVVPDGVQRLLWCPPKGLPMLMGTAKCVLCVNLMEVDGYASDRDLMVRAAGAIPVRTVEEAEAACRLTAAERTEIGRGTRNEALANHTYDNRVFDILRDYDRGFVSTVPWEEEAEATERCRQDAIAELSGV